MLSYIKGTLEEVRDGIIVVDNHGIGYEINTSFETISNLSETGSEVKVFTKLIPREDSINLYGFFTREELKMFELLLTVSGIGPKGALAVLSSMTVEDIKFAVVGSDSKAFSKVPGIGKKTAERVIIDLKDKVDFTEAFEAKITKSKSSKSNISSIKEEVLEALTSLGYAPSVAAKALDKMSITENTDVEQLLSDTLKQMSFL